MQSVIIIDDHPLILESVTNIVKSISGFTLCGVATNGKEGIGLILDKKPDIIIADIDMPILNGVDMVNQVHKTYAWIKVIYLTSHVNLHTFLKATSSNYLGFVFKENASIEIEQCLNTITKGDHFHSNGFEEFMAINTDAINNVKTMELIFRELTKTEIKILKEISEGKTTNEIAARLYNSVKTIENHRYNICRKLNIEGSNKLLCFAIENRLFLHEGVEF